MDIKFVRREQELTCIDVKQFFSISSHYWCSELLSVGIAVLGKLEDLYNFSLKNSSSSSFREVKYLIYIHEVAKFLLDSKFLSRRLSDKNVLDKYLKLLSTNFFDCLFPIDSRQSVKENILSFRRTDMCRTMLADFVERQSSSASKLSDGQLGKMTVAVLGSARHNFNPVKGLLKSKKFTMDWMRKSCRDVKDSYGAVVLRLVALACLIYVYYGKGREYIPYLVSLSHGIEHLPREFYDTLRRMPETKRSKVGRVNLFAECFKLIGNPLVIVSLNGDSLELLGSNAIFVEMKSRYEYFTMTSGKSIDDVLKLLNGNQKQAIIDQPEEASDRMQQPHPVISHLWDTFERLISSESQVEGEINHVQIDSSIK
ncbi:hypothetical protein LINGRAHAP2_LOCUS23707, partial [Linum grandiflorum]